MNLSLRRLYVIMGSVTILILLHVIYVYYISPRFGSAIYRYLKPDWASLLAHGVIACLPSLWMPIKIERPSQVAYWIHYFALYMPVILIPLYLGNLEPMRLYFYSLLFLALFGGIWFSQFLPLLKIPRFNLGWRSFCTLLIATSSFVILYTILSTGISGFSLNLATIYDTRSEMDSFVQKHGARIVYLTTWVGNAIHPTLIAIGLVKRRPLLLAFGIFGQLILFWTMALKSILFSIVLAVAIYHLLKKRNGSFGVRFISGICIFIPLCLFIDSFMEIPWATALSSRRIMIVPGMLTGNYLDFFDKNPFIFMSDNLLSSFFEYPYRMGVPNLIGMEYLNDVNASANVNYWASAYAHFGVVGLVVFTLLFITFMWIYDSLAYGRHLFITGIMISLPAITLTNSSLQTSLLTHGLGVLVIVLYFLPKEIPVWQSQTQEMPPQHEKEGLPVETV